MNEFLANSTVEAYDARFQSGYMQGWEPAKRQRVAEFLSGLELPATGRALDFGCGTGFFTGVLAEVLPGWEVMGSDFSPVAVGQATAMRPGLRFVVPDALDGAFDLLFTHHVLEHVADLHAVMAELDRRGTPQAVMVHVLPCGNAGSFEHGLAASVRDGISARAEGRFYFEEEGHVRRLTSAQLDDLVAPYGFTQVDARYLNHTWQSYDFITRSLPQVIDQIANPAIAADSRARRRLRRLRLTFRTVAFARNPSATLGRSTPGRAANRALRPLSQAANRWFEHKTDQEWQQRKRDPAGGEMMVAYRR